MEGILYVVGTPIGNLGDITLRALETLKAVDVIAAEDTRVTKKLLDRYEIRKPLISLRARSPRAAFEKVATLVSEGKSIAYVTDAGTPGISDPGSILVQLVRDQCGEKSIVIIPGVSALTAVLSVAGMRTDRFSFLGFLPHKKGRQKMLDIALSEGNALVLFESPHRIKKLFVELSSREPDREAVIGRELTKMYESIVHGTIADLRRRLDSGDIPTRGEFVVVIGSRL